MKINIMCLESRKWSKVCPEKRDTNEQGKIAWATIVKRLMPGLCSNPLY